MPNQIITNKQASVIDLTPLRDVYDVTVVLRPKGEKGDSREVSAETAADEIIERVKGAGWVGVSAVGASAAPAPAPAPEPTPTPVAVTAPEPTMEMSKDQVDALVEETKPEPEPEQPPARTKRR